MPSYHANTHGQGVVIATPNTMPGSNALVESYNTDGSFAGWIPAGGVDLAANYAWTGTHSWVKPLIIDTGAHFNTETVNTPAGTTETIDLKAKNHQTLDTSSAIGDLTVTIEVPAGSTAGTILIKQGATARDITWFSTSTVTWLTAEPVWSDEGNTTRSVSWRYDQNGDTIYLLTTVESSSIEQSIFSVKEFGANGIVSEDDDAAAFQACFDAAAAGDGVVYVPTGTYTLNSAVKPASGLTIRGDGSKSIIRPGFPTWPQTGESLGIISLDDVTDVHIEHLKFDGREQEFIDEGHDRTNNDYPKMIYANDNSALHVNHCEVDGCSYEAFWGGATANVFGCTLTNSGLCRLDDNIGDTWTALPCIQFTGAKCVFIGNRIINGGTGIGAIATDPVVVGNSLFNLKGDGIAIGDGGTKETATIVGNHIEVVGDTDQQKRAIRLTGGAVGADHGIMNVTGNSIVMTKAVGNLEVKGISIETMHNAHVTGNSIECHGGGIGIFIQTQGRTTDVHLASNVVKLFDEVMGSWAYNCSTGNSGILNLWSTNNKAIGFSNAGYAFDWFVANATDGINNVYTRNDFCDTNANIRFKYDVDTEQTYFAGELQGRPFNINSDLTTAPDFQIAYSADFYTRTDRPAANQHNFIAAGAVESRQPDASGRFYERLAIRGEGGSPTDDLDTINGGVRGDRLTIEPFAGTTLTVKHNTGNILLKAGTDFALADGGLSRLRLEYTGTHWVEI